MFLVHLCNTLLQSKVFIFADPKFLKPPAILIKGH
jgi:hypothetical protein